MKKKEVVAKTALRIYDLIMTSLTALVEVSEKVASTKSKKEKISLLAHLLLQARGRKIILVASYLSGQLPQGRLGIGWATQ